MIAAAVNRVADPWLAETIGRIGYDVIWFDMEHRSFGFERIDGLSLACCATAASTSWCGCSSSGIRARCGRLSSGPTG